MSSIVSLRPSSRNHWNEAFWMSIRLGRSRTFSILEKDLRARGEATLLVKEEASLGDVRAQANFRRANVRTDGTSAQPARVPEVTPLPQAWPTAVAGCAANRSEPPGPAQGVPGTAQAVPGTGLVAPLPRRRRGRDSRRRRDGGRRSGRGRRRAVALGRARGRAVRRQKLAVL